MIRQFGCFTEKGDIFESGGEPQMFKNLNVLFVEDNKIISSKEIQLRNWTV
jgi:hypothetical protein